ncbi:hypothetical protein MCHI_001313 [Candidatus Magnetoovum chiemensis]|nr:hypothetical protein MCHI_001313 [Candidatus Magnetoovum chiemensis]
MSRQLAEYETYKLTTKEETVIDEIKSRIFNRLIFPAHWTKEGIAQPNMACKEKAFKLCRHIFEIYDRAPDRIAPSKEEGVFIAFDSPTGDKSLFIEVYNNLEASYIVNDNVQKRILLSDDISEFSFDKAIKYING